MSNKQCQSSAKTKPLVSECSQTWKNENSHSEIHRQQALQTARGHLLGLFFAQARWLGYSFPRSGQAVSVGSSDDSGIEARDGIVVLGEVE